MLHCDKDARSREAIQGESMAENRTMGQPVAKSPIHATVIVPAHNEAKQIEASMRSIQNACDHALSALGYDLAVVVVCNACSDDTAARAAQAAPDATIVETRTRGKTAAINLAISIAPPGPIVVVDADVTLEPNLLGAVLAALTTEDALAASPTARFVLTGASLPVRAYFRTFAKHPYLASGVGGSGVYALSAAGRERLDTFPTIAADDEYVRNLFPLESQRRISRDSEGQPVAVEVRPPETLLGLLRAEIRSRNGDRVVRHLCAARANVAQPWASAALRAAPLEFAIFIAVKLTARLLMPLSRSGRADGWATHRQ
jgi:glycosyltransferase involved in cell wall biosynthesis